METSLESIIVNNLIHNETFCRKSLPHLKPEYFEGSHRLVYQCILDFIAKYNKLPNATALDIEFGQSESSRHPKALEAQAHIQTLKEPLSVEEQWLLDSTEKWCKDRAVHLAIIEAVSIIDGKSPDKAEGSIPSILSKALSVTFDTNVGHDYLENVDSRYEFYHKTEDKIPFDLDMFNTITGGGIPRKTLNIILAGCVHPDTAVRVRLHMTEKVIAIKEVEALLNEGYTIEVHSPDGYVPVSAFVDKGMWDEYVLLLSSGKTIRVNENHLFETIDGWKYAKDLVHKKQEYLTEDSYEIGIVTKTGKQIPIVDITVDHENHRYYTDGVSSHNTGCGKSLGMCHMAAAALAQGRNVLYITLEMAEERIAERIDANLLDIRIDKLKDLSQTEFSSRVGALSKRTHGKLIVKEYPTAAAHVGHFRALLLELKLKKKFEPDIIYVDYLNICASSRIKGLSGGVNTYSLIKSIAEELRGLAVEFNVPIWSATQVTRGGFNNSDISITDTSESFGLPSTADLMIAFIRTEQLDKMGQIMVKQLKNRYNDPTTNKRFTVGIDLSKMRLYDISDPMSGIVDDSEGSPVVQTPFGSQKKSRDYSGIKV